jgi:hypothetical protein
VVGRAGAGGIDVQHGAAWTIRHNLLRRIALNGAVARPAITLWNDSATSVIDGNVILNCQGGITLGQVDNAGTDHTGGIIRNNMIARAANKSGGPAITLAHAPGTQVLHNSVLLAGTYPWAIDARATDTVDLTIANNLLDGTVSLRQGASGQVTHNDVAFAALFVDPVNADLHLKLPAAAAVGAGIALPGATVDFDGDTRPTTTAPDLGADQVSAAAPVLTPSPSETVVPSAAAIIDTPLTTWTLGADLKILRDGVHTAGGYATVLYWSRGQLYAFGTDSNWYGWTGSSWANLGATKPA